MNRRGFLLGAAAASGVILAAPSIVRAASIMPVSVLDCPMTVAEMLRVRQAWLKHVEKIIRAPLFEAVNDLLIFGQAITRITADGVVVRVPPAEWHCSLPDDSVRRLELVPLK